MCIRDRPTLVRNSGKVFKLYEFMCVGSHKWDICDCVCLREKERAFSRCTEENSKVVHTFYHIVLTAARGRPSPTEQTSAHCQSGIGHAGGRGENRFKC